MAGTIKALTELRHMPASPGVLRRAQILLQNQQQQQQQAQANNVQVSIIFRLKVSVGGGGKGGAYNNYVCVVDVKRDKCW